MTLDTQRLADNKTLALIGRVSMIVASTFVLPVALWMLNRVATSADDIAAKVDKGSVQMQLLQQEVKFGFDSAKGDITAIRSQLTDHEGRIRVLERPVRPN